MSRNLQLGGVEAARKCGAHGWRWWLALWMGPEEAEDGPLGPPEAKGSLAGS